MTLVPVLVSVSPKEGQQLSQSCWSYQCQWDAHNTVPQWNYQRGPRVSWQRWDLVWPDWVSILWCRASASRERGRKWDPSYFHLISNEIAGEISLPLPPSPGYFSQTSVWGEVACKCISADVCQTMHVAKKTHGWAAAVTGNTCLFSWIQLWCRLFWQTFKTVKASISPRSLESKGEMCGAGRFVYSAVHSAPSVCQMSREPSSQKWEGLDDYLCNRNRIIICIELPRIALLEQTQVSRWLRQCVCTIYHLTTMATV